MVTNPVPTISSLSPNNATAYSSQFLLTVNGGNFSADSVVNWDGTPLTTTFVSASQVTATIAASNLTSMGSVSVTVTNPAPGGGTTSGLTFSVTNPVPTITSLTPTSTQTGGAQFTLIVDGTNYLLNSVVNWNGTALTTTFVTSTRLTAVVPSGNITSAVTANITVTNPTPGGGTTSVTTFDVTNPVPTLSSLSQTAIPAASNGLTITLTGTHFTSTSVAQWAGSNRTTHYLSATAVSMDILTSDLVSSGSFAVTVSNPAPGGGVSSGVNFNVTNPVPIATSLDPASIATGSDTFTLTVTGSRFIPTSVVKWGGVALMTSYVDSNTLTATVSSTRIVTAGSSLVSVTNPTPGGGTSGNVKFIAYSSATTCPISGGNVTISSTCNFDPGTYVYTGTLTIAAPVTFTAVDTVNIDGNVTVASNGTLTQAGTSGVVVSGAFVAQNGATLTHVANTSTLQTNVLDVTANTIEIASGASVNVLGKGFSTKLGPGYGNSYGSGYGGNGGATTVTSTKGITYGSLTQPTDVGSGGVADGSNGGGAVKLTSVGTLEMNGDINANGTSTRWSGSSGGSVWIQAGTTLSGTGTIEANGASTVDVGWQGGGGGRIAVVSGADSSSFSMTAFGGTGSNNGGAGTIYRKTSGSVDGDVTIDNNGTKGGWTSLAGSTTQSYDNLTVANGAIFAIPAGDTLVLPSSGSITGGTTSSTIANYGTFVSIPSLTLSNMTFIDAGTVSNLTDLTIGSGGVFSQGTTSEIALSGTLLVQNGGTLTHVQNGNTQTSQINISASSIEIDAGGLVNVDGKGYIQNSGPGRGSAGAAGGHGGNGGAYAGSTPGSANDSVSQPVNLGSGGSGVDAVGGGAVKLLSSGDFLLDGTISADGISQSTPQAAGAAGGAVWIQAATALSGSGTISANGGRGQQTGSSYGGGAGGRIALVAATDSSSLLSGSHMQAYGGTAVGGAGGAGTIYSKFGSANANLIVDNNGNTGAKTPLLNSTETYDDVKIVNKANYEIPFGKTLEIASNHSLSGGNGGTLTIDAGGTLSGTADTLVTSANIVNNGTISASQLVSSAPITQNGTLSASTLVVADSTYTYTGAALGADNLIVASGGIFLFSASGTNTNDVTLPGDVTVEAGGLITHATNTSATKVYYANISANNITILNGGAVDVSGKGSPTGLGQGAGVLSTYGSGAGYGGVGGSSSNGIFGGFLYGSSTEPNDIGSGGGNPGHGGSGGGAMKLFATGTMTIDGVLAADGGSASRTLGGGGSGGSIWLQAATLTCNPDGALSVAGGNAYDTLNGGGAGGRVSYTGTTSKDISCPVNITGGTGYLGAAAAGTTNDISPLPVFTDVTPATVVKGSGNLTVSLHGSGFVTSSYGQWNGSYRPTYFVTSTQMNMIILATDLVASGTNDITVFSPAPGGGVSESVPFTINNPVPTITDLNPNYVRLGDQSATVYISGTNFVTTSVFQFNGHDEPTTYMTANGVRATIPAADFPEGGLLPVTVTNPIPGGGVSNAATMTVYNVKPTLTSMDPTAALTGSDDTTVTFTGSSFVPQTYIVLYTNTATENLATTYISDTQVSAVIPASYLTHTGTMTLRAYSPYGGTSDNGLSFSASNALPTISGVAPSAGTSGLASQVLVVTGTGFVSGSAAYLDGMQMGSVVNSATQITMTLSAAALSTGGSHALTVHSPPPGGGISDPVSFDLTNGTPTISNLSPAAGYAGVNGQVLTVNGTGFVTDSVIEWNGIALPTTYVSYAQIRATIPAEDLVSTGVIPVTVVNPAPGGGTSSEKSFTITNPQPSISLLSPSSAGAGSPDLTLTVYGANFVSGSVIKWNSTVESTTYVSSTALTTTIPSANLTTFSIASVTVVSPTPGGGSSNAKSFTVTNAPVIASLSTTSTSVHASAFTLTVNGSNFDANSTVKWNATPLSTSFVSASQLTADVTSAQLSVGGVNQISVLSGTGAVSQVATMTVNSPVPHLTDLSPTTIGSGSSDSTMTVNGSGFTSTSVVQWNGSNRDTTFVSDTQLNATILASDLATPGTALVTVLTSAPGGGITSSQTVTVSGSTITLESISPTSAYLNASYVALTVNGSGFTQNTQVKLNDIAVTTTYLSDTQVGATIPGEDLTSTGTFHVTVSDPSGVATGSQTFTVNNPAPSITSLTPSAVYAQGPSFFLTVNGLDFLSSSVVKWNGSPIATTFIDHTTLHAQVLSSLTATTGTSAITVSNPTPGGGTSNAVSLFIQDRSSGNNGQVILRANVMDVPSTLPAPIVADVVNGSQVSAFHLIAGSNATMYVHGMVSDENGCETLSSIHVKVYLEDAGSNCTPDGDTCAETTSTSFLGCTPQTADATYAVTLPIPHNMEPTDAGSPYEGKKWYVTVTATDSGNVQGIGTSSPFDIGSLIAFDVSPSIDYGTVVFGQTSGKKQVTFVNKGNRVLDASFLSNGPMVCQGGGTIPSEDVHLSLQPTDAFADMTSISSLAVKMLQLGLAKKTLGSDPEPTAFMYAQLFMPEHAGVAGTCSNSLTFTASGR